MSSISAVLKYTDKKFYLSTDFRYFTQDGDILGRVGQEMKRSINEQKESYLWYSLTDIPAPSLKALNQCRRACFSLFNRYSKLSAEDKVAFWYVVDQTQIEKQMKAYQRICQFSLERCVIV